MLIYYPAVGFFCARSYHSAAALPTEWGMAGIFSHRIHVGTPGYTFLCEVMEGVAARQKKGLVFYDEYGLPVAQNGGLDAVVTRTFAVISFG